MPYRNIFKTPVVQLDGGRVAFQMMRDFICRRYAYFDTGIGWDLVDSNYAIDENTISNADYCVLRSYGESGNDLLYVRLISTSATMITVQHMNGWNFDTKAVVNAYTISSSMMTSASYASELSIYGDLDEVHILLRQVFATGYAKSASFGRLYNTFFDTYEVRFPAQAYSSGSDVEWDVGSVPASWVVGGEVMYRNCIPGSVSTGIGSTTIVAKTATTITVNPAPAVDTNTRLTQDMGIAGIDNALYPRILRGHDNSYDTSGVSMIEPGYPTVQCGVTNNYYIGPLIFGTFAANKGLYGYLKYMYGRGLTGFVDGTLYDMATDGNSPPFAFLDGGKVRAWRINNSRNVAIYEV